MVHDIDGLNSHHHLELHELQTLSRRRLLVHWGSDLHSVHFQRLPVVLLCYPNPNYVDIDDLQTLPHLRLLVYRPISISYVVDGLSGM